VLALCHAVPCTALPAAFRFGTTATKLLPECRLAVIGVVASMIVFLLVVETTTRRTVARSASGKLADKHAGVRLALVSKFLGLCY